MHWLLWVLLLLFLLVFVLLVLPFQVEFDTQTGVFRLEWLGIGGVLMAVEEADFKFYYRLFFWQREWHFKSGKKQQEQEETPRKPAKKKKAPQKRGFMTPKRMFALVRNVLRAIKIKRFRVDIDTDNYVRNAQLYPLFLSLSRGKRQLHINFEGRQEVSIFIQTRLINLAGAMLKTYIHR